MRFVGILLVILALPALVVWLQGHPKRWQHAALAVGLAPFAIGLLNLDASLISWAMWPGHSRGLTITILDSLALAILIATRRRIGTPPFTVLLGLYAGSAMLSVAFSNVPMGSVFYAFQTIRILVFYLAVTIVLQDRKNWDWICYGLAWGAILQAGFTISQKLQGSLQATGTMGHQNLLGMMLHFVTIPLFARILAGDRNKIVLSGFFSGLLAASLTASRGTLGFLALGIVLLAVMSLVRKSTALKWRAIGLGVFAAVLFVPLAMSGLSERFETLGEEGYDERAALEKAATLMWDDHPMGVGANQYVVTANADGYSSAAGVAPVFGSRSAHVHNIYLLNAAEMGWLGLLTFSLILVAAIYRGLRQAFRSGDEGTADMVLGATAAILTMSIHGFYEWIIIYDSTQYLFAISLAMIAVSITNSRRQAEFSDLDTQSPVRFDPIIEQVVR